MARTVVGSPQHRYPLFHNWREVPEADYPEIHVAAAAPDAHTIRIPLSPGEAIWGIGPHFDAVNMRGQHVDCRLPDNGDEPHASTFAVPFFISSTGYGLWVNSSARVAFDVGATEEDELVITNPDEGVEVIVFYGTPAQVLQAYSDLIGRPRPLPDWVYRPWMSRHPYYGAYEVNRVVRRMDELGMPVGAVVLGSWTSPSRAWQFDRPRFPNPITWMRRLQQHGIHTVCRVAPGLAKGTAAFDEAYAHGHLVLDKEGSPRTVPGWDTLGLLDFRQPSAHDAWRDLLRPLPEMGVSGFLTDHGHAWPDPAVCNRYSFDYQQATLEAFTLSGIEDGVLMARTGNPLSAQHLICWAGEHPAEWSRLSAMIRGGISAALSGFAFWAHDVGGATGVPAKALYIRWLQVGVFSPILSFRGDPPREPWHYDAETVAIAQFYFRVRERLLPDLVAWGQEARATGAPIIRPLVWSYPDDPNTFSLDDQYTLGPDLLVAPITSSADARVVYLPEGDWVNLWDSSRHRGPLHLPVTAALHEIPLFVRHAAHDHYRALVGNPPEGPTDPLTVEWGGDRNERGIAPRVLYLRDRTQEEDIVYHAMNDGEEPIAVAMRLTPHAGITIEPDQVVRFTLPPRASQTVVFTVQADDTASAGTYPLALETWPERPGQGERTVALVLSPTWEVLGPFPGGVGSEQPFESVLIDRVDDGVTPLPWQSLPSVAIGPEGLLDMSIVTGGQPFQTLYLRTTLFSRWPRRALFYAGCGDAMTIWLNGREVFHVPAHRRAERDEDVVPAVLIGGQNDVLIRISLDQAAPHGYFRVE